MQTDNSSNKSKYPPEKKPGEQKVEKKFSGFSLETMKNHKNPVIRIFGMILYSIWLVVMGIGIFFAWLISVLML